MGTQKNGLKEPFQWDGSFEHPKQMFKLMGKEINAILGAQTILIWTHVLRVHVVSHFKLMIKLQYYPE